MVKPLVFISHITEESSIATALKTVLEASFLRMMEVFVSSDPTSLNLGSAWGNEIKAGLENCAVQIVIASLESVKRPWINFEAGAVWIQGKPVIPLCHSGMVPASLPSNLRQVQGTVADDAQSLTRMVPTLAKALGSEQPTIDFGPFIQTVRDFEKVTRESAALTAQAPIAPVHGLAQHEMITLLAIAQLTGPNISFSIRSLQGVLERAGFTSLATSLASKTLERKGLIRLFEGEPQHFGEINMVARITDDGWCWLSENSHLLNLKNAQSENFASDEDEKVTTDDDIPF